MKDFLRIHLMTLWNAESFIPDRHDFIERMNGSPGIGKETSGLPGHAVLGSLQ
jgi:hypothetical protein